ncbi:helix-turn-helix domain-containing protein [Pseudoduganella sp. FT26W]|uniref:Helix-turn-helix domain-containing protein n=1 Tax=Duganella aquatilis TaxID=2666082 RepID=A0A844DAQ1_9BURK|nr:XRE family transcriptional regulator [Duganella aquatilis]MRW85386.1 helix-turn-helix domain-containing protein [Duganella aquatilis]
MVDKFDTFAERLKYLRSKSGLSLAALAKQLGVSAQAAHKWENGGRVDSDRLWALAALFKVDPSWLMQGPVIEDGLEKKPHFHYLVGAPSIPKTTDSGVFVPLLDAADVIEWTTQEGDISFDYHKGEWVACPAPHGGLTFALMVKGVSMENLGSKVSYSDGDMIFVDPEVEPTSGVRAVFSASGLSRKLDVVFRELIVEGGQRFWRSLNPQWPQAISPVEEKHQVLGVVIGKWSPER